MSLPPTGQTVLVTGTASDSHTWNLVYLQLFVEELGYRVVNLGPCVTDDLLAEACRVHRPDLVVISSVNGHGYRDGLSAVTRLRRGPGRSDIPVVIGGKLGVLGERSPEAAARLLAAGCDAVFDDADLDALREFLTRPAAGARTAHRHAGSTV
ncbi:cobalamin-dependent protein [Streptomyces sp. SL13]|uniref:Cobalamin-dependent protein n=1 Tax=Streptantibioticus silvisoli TaxID=2705255 RepID=A0AA90H6T1_9ACTN|nr:cobalamin-dependent protein [Streptantibioticus silvisoli]MDI5963338.1 cobalamin-dependent protein [Streptantibioticus silvisoli]MDI5972010.1 cobalamin-dependent protein [Streptantibioticus silvisoli]